MVILSMINKSLSNHKYPQIVDIFKYKCTPINYKTFHRVEDDFHASNCLKLLLNTKAIGLTNPQDIFPDQFQISFITCAF